MTRWDTHLWKCAATAVGRPWSCGCRQIQAVARPKGVGIPRPGPFVAEAPIVYPVARSVGDPHRHPVEATDVILARFDGGIAIGLSIARGQASIGIELSRHLPVHLGLLVSLIASRVDGQGLEEVVFFRIRLVHGV